MISWVLDVEPPGHQRFSAPLFGARTYPGEPEHEAVIMLVRYAGSASSRTALYAHGWSDYFFQTHLAEAIENWGYDFYALDLRRYSRSLRDGQLAGYIADLGEYHQEPDIAVEVIHDEGYDHLVLLGRSTGGLVVSLFVHDRSGTADAVVLNSLWLELQSPQAWRPALAAAFGMVGALSPTRVPPISDPDFYRRSISAGEEEEWHYNHNLRGDPAFLPRIGQMLAVMCGHVTVAAGLGIETPVLTLISARSDPSRTWNDDIYRVDLVLDVDALAARASQLGDYIALTRIHGGGHDLALPQEEPRRRFLDEIRRWLAAYGPGGV